MALDIQIFHFFNNFARQSRIFDTLVVFLAEYFQYLLVVVFLLLLYFSGYARSEKIRIFLVTIGSIIVARFGVAEIIRFLYHRPRPFLVLEAHKLISNSDWFYSDKEWSFPSGHSAFFFAMATAIYLYDKKWGVGFFIAAILMNISRIVAGVHYPSDILGGAVVGILVGHAIFYFAEKREPREIAKTL